MGGFTFGFDPQEEVRRGVATRFGTPRPSAPGGVPLPTRPSAPGVPPPPSPMAPGMTEFAPGVGFRQGDGFDYSQIAPTPGEAWIAGGGPARMDSTFDPGPFTPVAAMAASDVEALLRARQAQQALNPELFDEDEPRYSPYTEGLISRGQNLALERRNLMMAPADGRPIPKIGAEVMEEQRAAERRGVFDQEMDQAIMANARRFGVDPSADPSGARTLGSDPVKLRAYQESRQALMDEIRAKYLLFNEAPRGAQRSRVLGAGGFDLE